jgi:hypothetical protein
MSMNLSPAMSRRASTGAARFFFALGRGFIAYARWLDGISWMRFFLLSLLAVIVTGIVSALPPFNLRWGPDRTEVHSGHAVTPKEAAIVIDGIKKSGKSFEINIDDQGVRITPVRPAASAASAVPAPPRPAVKVSPDGVTIRVPDSVAIEEAQARLEEAITDGDKEAIDEAKAGLHEAIADVQPRVRVIKAFRLSDHMVGFMVALIFVSMIVKIMAAGRFKAEAQAVQATEIAESEALKRQVVEARMAAMQAQVEPHFLFNTLASIDHLIETDPSRASKMQKNLIALLRASMPTMREANAQGTRDLGRELAVIRPYLEILKVRMEERLRTEVRVPDGLMSADFPPMMLQSLVENAIKHGLEPKAEGGALTVSAQIVHGKLAVTVADTGLGFGKAATAGTGIGLDNIRERLQLLYGHKASLTVAENPGGGTAVTITVPYATSHHPGENA